MDYLNRTSFMQVLNLDRERSLHVGPRGRVTLEPGDEKAEDVKIQVSQNRAVLLPTETKVSARKEDKPAGSGEPATLSSESEKGAVTHE